MNKLAWSWIIIMSVVSIATGVALGTPEQPLSLAEPVEAIREWVASVLHDGPRLTGIIIGSHASAIIGGKVVREGNTIGNANVVKIEMGHVHFETKGERWIETVGSKPGKLRI